MASCRTMFSRKRKFTNGPSSRAAKIRGMVQKAHRRRATPALQAQLGVETKFLDAPRTTLALTAPADATGGEISPSSIVTGCLSAPAQGDGPTNRDGHKILIKSILVQGMIQFAGEEDQTATNSLPTVFCALVQDKQSNGATLNSEDVYTNPVASGVCAVNPLRNMSFTSRFKVLDTWQHAFEDNLLQAFNDQATTTFAQQGGAVPFTLSKKFKTPLRVTFTTGSTTADIANVIDNSLHVIAFCSSTTTNPNILYNSRMRFVG